MTGPRGSRKQPQFTDDHIRRNDIPKDAFGLIHDLCYDHEGRDRWQYRERAQAILSTPAAPETPPDSVESLKEALRKYGKHLTGCACFDEFDETACDCGFGKYEVSL